MPDGQPPAEQAGTDEYVIPANDQAWPMWVQLCGKVYRTSFRPKPTVPRCRCTQLMADRLAAGLTTVVIYQRSAIRYAVTGRTLVIAPGSITDPLPNSPTQGTSLHCIR